MKASKTSSMCRTFRFSVLLWFVAFLDCFSTSTFSSITWTVCSDCLITGEEAGRSEASDLRIRQVHYNIIWKLLKHLPLVSDLDELGLPSVSISVAPSWDWFVLQSLKNWDSMSPCGSVEKYIPQDKWDRNWAQFEFLWSSAATPAADMELVIDGHIYIVFQLITSLPARNNCTPASRQAWSRPNCHLPLSSSPCCQRNLPDVAPV